MARLVVGLHIEVEPSVDPSGFKMAKVPLDEVQLFDPPMVEALVRGLDEHGWDPEVVPLFSPPDAEQVFDQDWQAYDHDDPTDSVAQDSR